MGLAFIFLVNLQTLWIVIASIFVGSVFQAVQQPTVSAIIPVMVPKKMLSRLNSVNMILSSGINIIAPIIAGILLGILEVKYIVWIDVITYLIALIPTILITIPPVALNQNQKENKVSFFEEMKEGFRAITNIKGMVAIFASSIINNFLLVPQNSLRTYFISVYHEGSPQILSYISAALQTGIFLGAIFIALRKQWKRKSLLLFGGSLCIGIGYFITGITSKGNFILIGIGTFILGLGFPILNSTYLTILQDKIPLDKQGRVNSIDIAVSLSIMPLSNLITGPLADRYGINYLYIVCSSLFLVSFLSFWIFSDYRKIDDNERDKDASSTLSTSDDIVLNSKITPDLPQKDEFEEI